MVNWIQIIVRKSGLAGVCVCVCVRSFRPCVDNLNCIVLNVYFMPQWGKKEKKDNKSAENGFE